MRCTHSTNSPIADKFNKSTNTYNTRPDLREEGLDRDIQRGQVDRTIQIREVEPFLESPYR
jgi:hypothetical protein